MQALHCVMRYCIKTELRATSIDAKSESEMGRGSQVQISSARTIGLDVCIGSEDDEEHNGLNSVS